MLKAKQIIVMLAAANLGAVVITSALPNPVGTCDRVNFSGLTDRPSFWSVKHSCENRMCLALEGIRPAPLIQSTPLAGEKVVLRPIASARTAQIHTQPHRKDVT
jgi:hypothetical protein